MELFFYNKIDSIIPTVVLPTTEIIEPIKDGIKETNDVPNKEEAVIFSPIKKN